jgi:hypothetical protein
MGAAEYIHEVRSKVPGALLNESQDLYGSTPSGSELSFYPNSQSAYPQRKFNVGIQWISPGSSHLFPGAAKVRNT